MNGYRKNSSIKCPFCGKRHTIPILYGMPSCEAFLEEEAGKIWLGGRKISVDSPSRYCKDCRKSFGKASESFRIIENVLFFVGGFNRDNHFIDISLASNSYILIYRHLLPFNSKSDSTNSPIEQTKKLSVEEVKYLQGIIPKLYILEWPSSSIDSNILDGTQWSIEIKYQGKRKIKKHGSNKFPPYFTELVKAMSKLNGGQL
jgi:hypothetical protein